jgi:hypothetical protein
VLEKGKARVISYKGLKEKRATKDRAAEAKSKGKHSYKQKVVTQEHTEHAASSMQNDKVARRSEEQECGLFRAPEAKMC